jgi:hypothetical protein
MISVLLLVRHLQSFNIVHFRIFNTRTVATTSSGVGAISSVASGTSTGSPPSSTQPISASPTITRGPGNTSIGALPGPGPIQSEIDIYRTKRAYIDYFRPHPCGKGWNISWLWSGSTAGRLRVSICSLVSALNAFAKFQVTESLSAVVESGSKKMRP